MYRKGYAAYYGDGVEEDAEEAVRLFRAAALKNYAQAQFMLASCLFSGDGVSEDREEAMEWFRRAADNGSKEALSMLTLFQDLNNNRNYPGKDEIWNGKTQDRERSGAILKIKNT